MSKREERRREKKAAGNNPFELQRGVKDARTEDESRRIQIRTGMLLGMFCCVLLVFVVVLYDIQVVHGEDYLANASAKATQTETVDSVRGELLDRYGRVLVTNAISYNVTLDVKLMGEDRNDILTQLLALCREAGVEWADSLPVSETAPWTYTGENVFSYLREGEDGETTVQITYLGQLAKKYGWVDDPAEADLSAAELLAAMCETFGIRRTEGTAVSQEARELLGVLYEVYLRSSDILRTEYVFAQNVDVAFISKVKEHSLTGVTIETASARQYNTTYAAHVLGRTGKYTSDAMWQTYKEKGYPYNAVVGLEGAELAFEEYLHGASGVRQIETNENGKLMSQTWITEPEPGDNVVLTLDIGLQTVVEDELAEFVSALEDPGGAAGVVLDMTGGVLAMGSYPTFDLSTYAADFTQLLEDSAKPLTNRATQGLYAPGSTFKMVTAVAGLSSGVITPKSTVTCTGVYTYYPDTHPTCWIYPGAHGVENVTRAIKDSCNVFFYDVGRRVGIETLRSYAAQFGLGQYTGIEIAEQEGFIAGPETSEYFGQVWYGGATMFAAIGQENNQFTPLQLANYVATLVNGGNRYQVHLLKEVKSSDYSQVVCSYEPVVLNTVDIQPEHLAAVKQGMYDLAKTTSMARYFDSLPVEVGCKTGTAEVSGEEDSLAVFVCFAPYDDPQVAVCLVAEKGSSGGSLAAVAADILAYYFATDSSLSGAEGENTLMH